MPKIHERHPELAAVERALCRQVTPDLIERALTTAEGALLATRAIKTGDSYESLPDFAVRLRAVEIILSWGVGKPIERQLIIERQEKGTGLEGLVALAEESEEVRRPLIEMIEGLLVKIKGGSVPMIEAQTVAAGINGGDLLE